MNERRALLDKLCLLREDIRIHADTVRHYRNIIEAVKAELQPEYQQAANSATDGSDDNSVRLFISAIRAIRDGRG